jgi:rod shape determining protein RodA
MVCAGALAFIVFSVFQNVGMTIGIMPITGIPLPFMSYGGTALVSFFAVIGLAVNVGMRRGVRRAPRPR